MKYSGYFGVIFKSEGRPSISVEQYRRIMNIAFLEGEIKTMRSVEQKLTEDRDFNLSLMRKQHKYDMDFISQKKT